MIKNKNSQFGFTLIESIVALAIFVLITVIMHSVYLFNQQAYEEGERMAELVQNSRVILERITREVRQAVEIVTVLPQTDQGGGNPDELEFQDGHLPAISVTGTAAGGSTSTIVLAADSSTTTDYYNGMFLKITNNTGQGQTRKITSYDGSTKTAVTAQDWSVIPDGTSVYQLGSEYYYIRYYIPAGDNKVHRQYRVYCFDACGNCSDYFSWEDSRLIAPTTPTPCVLEDRVIGEYVSPGDLRFWGSNIINILLKASEDGREINLSTKVFGRNL